MANRRRDPHDKVLVDVYRPVKIEVENAREICIEKSREVAEVPVEYSPKSPIARENDSQTTPTKMDPESLLMELFCPTTISGEFNIEDFLPNDTLIEEPVPMVPDLFQWPLDEPDYAEENVLEGIIPSLEDPLLDSSDGYDGLDKLFFENYIDLAAFESCTNPNDFLFTLNQDSHCTMVENENIVSACPEAPQVTVVDESVAMVPEINDEMCATLLNSYPDGSPVDGFMLSIPTAEPNDAELLEPLSLLETFERSLQDQTNHTNDAQNNHGDGEPAMKGIKIELPTPVDETPNPLDKVTARRVKNNAASRVCRASRKARQQDLFEQEKKLASENIELMSQVDELSNLVDFLRQHLVEKLSAKST